jgi:asparagine synthase (glutamine-hydrolysing)
MLRAQHVLSDDAVFVPGHTGDFISGGHLKYLFDPNLWSAGPRDFKGAMVRKHYSLWADFVARKEVRAIIDCRLDEVTEGLPRESDEDRARMYEYWEWQERQSKFIVNSVRVYEFFGYSWRLPLWDREMMDFWRPITIPLKMRQYLYRRYVHTHDRMNLFQEDGPESIWTRDVMAQQRPKRLRRKVFDAASHFPVVTRLYDRYRIYRRHLREWKRHPLEQAHAYGKLRYLLLDSGKRHVQSLALRDFLRNEYGLEMSSLGRGREDGTAPRRSRTFGGPGGVGRTQWP